MRLGFLLDFLDAAGASCCVCMHTHTHARPCMSMSGMFMSGMCDCALGGAPLSPHLLLPATFPESCWN